MGSGPCIVQLAISDHIWVVDTAVLNDELQHFFRWVFAEARLRIIGFSVSHDIARLRVLIGDDERKESNFDILDLQNLAMQGQHKSHTLGLQSVVALYLGLLLDKTEQCSDWDRRPLTKAQLQYAAADAYVLLDVAAAMNLSLGASNCV